MPFKPVPRLGGFSYRGSHGYSLTICTHAKRPLFVADNPVATVMAQLLRATADFHFEICAYCFMPDHLHIVVAGTAPDASLTEFVRVFKQRSAYHWREVSGDRLRQRSFFEHVVRGDADLLRAVRYALENPVRAGLVPRVEDYPLVGSLTMQRPT